MASTFLLFKKQEFKIYASLELAYSTLLKSMSGKKIIRLTLTPNKRKSPKKDTRGRHWRGAPDRGTGGGHQRGATTNYNKRLTTMVDPD